MNQLEDMRILIEVADRGSFSAAALHLGLTKQLVSRRIIGLEDRLGVQLLNRTTRRLALTDLGADYVERSRRILMDIDDAEQAMANFVSTPRGTLRISAPLSFTQSHLSAFLTGFLALHPGVRLEVEMSDRQVDIVREGFDLAIRIGILTDSTLIARRLGAIHMVICATPDYLARHGTPTTLKDLQNHDCLEYRHTRGTTWPLTVNGKLDFVSVQGCYSANNGDVLRDAALAGIGLAQLPTFIVGEDIEQGRMTQVMDEFAPPPTAVYIVHPPHRQRSRLLRTFSDYLALGLSGQS